MPNKDDKIGALWLKKSAKGTSFLSGELNGLPVVVFKNNYKEQPKHPDYIVYRSQPREGQ